MEGFRGLEVGTDVQRVAVALPAQAAFAFFERGTQEGVAVGGQHDFPGLEVEGEDADVVAGYGEPVEDAVADVLLSHGLNHTRDDDGACRIVA